MTGPAIRLVTLVLALVALLASGLSPMASAGRDGAPVPAMHASHDGASPGASSGLVVACAVHCLAAAVLSTDVGPPAVPEARTVLPPGAPVRLTGLTPLPLRLPPKALVSS